MNIKEKHLLINTYQKGAYTLHGLVSIAPVEIIDHRADPSHWTIREHVSHLLDFELIGYTRYRRAIAESGTTVETYDEEQWQQNLDYTILNVHSSLLIIETIRTMTSTHLMSIVEDDWESYYINHPERGDSNLINLISLYIEHIEAHCKYIQRNIDAFIH